MKLSLLKFLLIGSLLATPSLLLADEIDYLNEAISNTAESIVSGRSGESDDMLEYLQNSRDYAVSAQAIQKSRHIKIAIHHLNSAISHASLNDFSGATKDAGLALLHLKYIQK
jgi:hypothetical protein